MNGARGMEFANVGLNFGEMTMNHSLRSADYTTHLKIVAVALAGAIAVVAIAINLRFADSGSAGTRLHGAVAVVKAGKPASYTASDVIRVR